MINGDCGERREERKIPEVELRSGDIVSLAS